MANTLLYFSKDADERGVYPAKNFLGCDMTDGDTMQVSFLKEDGTADAAIVSLTVDTTNSSAKEACKALAGALAGQKKGLTIIADTENSNFLYPFTAIESIA
jgi:hypothetical protein|tara:strand:+ start:83 stop:388 length:306 start_codon:yes stop_codon:yes gene_type:complete